MNLPRTLLCIRGLHLDLGHPVQGVLGAGELLVAILHNSGKGSVLSPNELLELGVEEIVTQLGSERLLDPRGTSLLALLILDGVLRWLM